MQGTALDDFTVKPIGIIHSCFKEKFGVPRQPGLVEEARAEIELFPPFCSADAVRELDRFSHLWIVFLFHASIRAGWKSTVRPPRLGGNKRVGVFASRSNFRPNPIGISAVKLEEICMNDNMAHLHLKGVDFLDKTPVLDIKPYIPYSDSISDAHDGYVDEAPLPSVQVKFSPQALAACMKKEKEGIPNLKKFIVQMLNNDPRPAYQGDTWRMKRFGLKIFDFDLKCEYHEDGFLVTSLDPLTPDDQ